MDNNFAFLNFCTEYSSQGNTQRKMRKDSCFATIFHSERNGVVQKNTYEIKLYKMGDVLNKKKQNNACLVDRMGIVHHLKVLQSVFKFGYRVKETKNYFLVKLTLDGDIIYHKYLLSWVRYLYEYPFNVFLVDAIRLKQLPKFRFESIINLFNIVGATSHITIHGTGIHAIGETYFFKEFLTTKEIQEALKNLEGGGQRLNDIFPYIINKHGDGLKTLDDGGCFRSSDYWNSEEEFTARLPFYQENYKIIKSKKKK